MLGLTRAALEYQRFSDEMSHYGYSWEAIEVTTEDGFILTTFHVLGNKKGTFKPNLPPVILQHGDFGDGVMWVSRDAYDNDNPPMALELANYGYDVYIGNNRGTEYSQKHTTLEKTDKAFWAWSWAEFGLYDDLANIKMMKEKSGADKVYYIGYSQGTTQIFYGLAHREKDFVEHLAKAVMFAPCGINEDYGLPYSYWRDTLFKFPSHDVHYLYGAGGEANTAKICAEMSKEACEVATCSDCQTVSV